METLPHHLSELTSGIAQVLNRTVQNAIDHDKLRDIIKAEILRLPPYKIELCVNDNAPKPIEGYARPEFKEALNRVHHRINVLLVGPAGSGKTYIARQIAESMGLRFGSISCTAGMSESQIQGWLLPRGEQGQFEYTQSVFVDIYENGGVFLFDEMDAADSNTLLFINQALANGSFFLPQRFSNTEIKRHPDCIIMGAANTYGTGGSLSYAGRERLDESTLDRFRAGVIEVGYDEMLEGMLVDDSVLAWGRQIRDKIGETKLQRVMSTRFLIDASRLKRSGSTLEQITNIYFQGWREDERRKVA